MPEQGVLGDEIGLVACKVCDNAENNRMAGRLSEMQESMFKEGDEAAEQLGQPMEEGKHVN